MLFKTIVRIPLIKLSWAKKVVTRPRDTYITVKKLTIFTIFTKLIVHRIKTDTLPSPTVLNITRFPLSICLNSINMHEFAVHFGTCPSFF